MFEKAVPNGANKTQVVHGSGPGGEVQRGTFIPADTIRLHAYRKWEAAGKPAGDDVGFWLAAEQELSRGKSRIRRWWTHIRPWIVPPRWKFIRRKSWQHG